MDVVLSGMDEEPLMEQSFGRHMFPEIKLWSRNLKNSIKYVLLIKF